MMHKIVHYQDADSISEIVNWLNRLCNLPDEDGDEIESVASFQIIESRRVYDGRDNPDAPHFDCVALLNLSSKRA